jgi:hypothetical protein
MKDRSVQQLVLALVNRNSLEEENETHAVVEIAFFNLDYFFYQFVQVCELRDEAGWFYQVWYNGHTLIKELGNLDNFTVTPFVEASKVVESHIREVIKHMEEHHDII